ncbi:MAG: ABC transporter permease [Dehalococcoidia bacterium]
MAANELAVSLGTAREPSRASRWRRWLVSAARRQPLAAIGAAIILITIAVAFLAPLLAPYPYDAVAVGDPLSGPSADNFMGTDQLGRDLMSRIIYGARVSMLVGFSVLVISTVLAFAIGVTSGFVGGFFDLVLQRIIDAVQAMPGIILALALVAFVGRDLINVIFVVGIILISGQARVMRSAAIAVKEMPFMEAARSMGATNVRIFFQHLFPNVVSVAIIYASLVLGQAIIIEGSLSFLGYGVQPPTPTWGGMLGVEGRRSLLLNPWMVVFPATALSLVVLGANMLGDGLRDLLDPRLRRGGH